MRHLTHRNPHRAKTRQEILKWMEKELKKLGEAIHWSAEIQHLGIRRCVNDPPSNRGRLTVWESHDLAQIQQILICCD
jgi:hypothetical protein